MQVDVLALPGGEGVEPVGLLFTPLGRMLMGVDGHGHQLSGEGAVAMFEPASWDERYGGEEQIWSGDPNAQLVAEVSALAPGTALDVGCGEGGDVIWLARRGWRVTGADFSVN